MNYPPSREAVPMLRRSNENTTITARTSSEMEELGAAFATIAFQSKPCMLI